MPHTLPPSAPELRASRLALGQDRLQLADAVLRVREEVRLHLPAESAHHEDTHALRGGEPSWPAGTHPLALALHRSVQRTSTPSLHVRG